MFSSHQSMSEEEVRNVDWQTACEYIKHRAAHLVRTGLWSDCTFLLAEGEAGSPESVPAHKLILAMASPVFEAMFFGIMANERPVKITDVSPPIFKALLRYIYTDEVNTPTFESACGLYYAAKKYMLESLSWKCMSYIQSNLNVKNVCQAYELARLFEQRSLMETCIKKIQNHTSRILKETSFENIELSTVEAIIAMDTMDVEGELELFEAAERYYEAHCKREGTVHVNIMDLDKLDDALNTTEASESLEAHTNTHMTISPNQSGSVCDLDMRRVLKHIRWLRLTPAQFAAGPALSALLSREEALAMLLRLCAPGAPPGTEPPELCASREPRNLPKYLKPPESQPAAEPCDLSEMTFEFCVQNFKTRRRAVVSEWMHMSDDFSWQLRVVPEGDLNDSYDKRLSVYVKCASRSALWRCAVEGRVRVLPLAGDQAPRAAGFSNVYSCYNDVHGVKNLISWADACDPRHGFVRGNCLSVEANVRVLLPVQTNYNII